ncbi:MAG: AIR carboxylase family protein, partial [Bifidobacterium sp.]
MSLLNRNEHKSTPSTDQPVVAVVMGSSSDWETMKHACQILDDFHIPYMKKVIAAHRTPELMADFAHHAR